MNMDNLDQGTLGQNAQDAGRPPQRGWWSRNWRWFVPTMLILVVLLGGGGIYGLLSAPLYNEVCRSAMQKIVADEAVRKELGTPVRNAWWPPASARVEDRETEIRWHIEGPKGRAKAHVKARLMAGKWEPVILEVLLDNDKKIDVQVGGDDGSVAPPFAGPKTESKKPETSGPPPEINLPAPPADMPEKK